MPNEVPQGRLQRAAIHSYLRDYSIHHFICRDWPSFPSDESLGYYRLSLRDNSGGEPDCKLQSGYRNLA